MNLWKCTSIPIHRLSALVHACLYIQSRLHMCRRSLQHACLSSSVYMRSLRNACGLNRVCAQACICALSQMHLPNAQPVAEHVLQKTKEHKIKVASMCSTKQLRSKEEGLGPIHHAELRTDRVMQTSRCKGHFVNEKAGFRNMQS